MLLHVALKDPGPFGRGTRVLAEKIQRFLARPKNRGRVIPQKSLLTALRCSENEFQTMKVFIAQEWLTLNQDSPQDAVAYYRDMLDTEMAKLDPDVGMLISKTIEEFPRQVYVTRKRAQKITQQVTAPLTEQFVRTYEQREVSVTARASALDEAIARVRDAYITAPIGDIPSIPELMRKLNLVDGEGHVLPGAPAGMSEAAIRERQLAEDWRAQRGDHVVRAFDIVPAEVKLVAVLRAVEMHRMLATHARALSAIYSNYYRTGEMKSLDGKKFLKMKTDPTVLASIAETMRRMLDGSGEKFSITLHNTTAAQQAHQAEGAKADVQLSLTTKEYIARMSAMSDAEIEVELAGMEHMRMLLANGGVTGDSASAQTIDVPHKSS